VRNLIRTAAVAAVAVSLSGCISLFGDSEPSKLYRFEIDAPSEVAAKSFEVQRGPIAFDRAAASDGILTVTGTEVAYIEGFRWAAPAQQIFEEQLVRAFQAGPARLIGRGETGKSDWIMRLDVQRFEADYRNGPEGAPVVVVELKVAMTRNVRDGATYETVIRTEAQASANRVSAIVPAYNKALTKSLTDLNSWVVTTHTEKHRFIG
jgi:cholesterol transport system auxiliary component